MSGASKGKGPAPAMQKDLMWVEKYRPRTLDDVAAHKEIIDTSLLSLLINPEQQTEPEISRLCALQ